MKDPRRYPVHDGPTNLETKQLKRKMSQVYLARLATLLHAHSKKVLILFMLLTILFGSFAVKLEQKTTLRDLMPEDNIAVRNFEETVSNFDLIDRVVVVVKFAPGELEAAEAFADIFVEQVMAQDETDNYLWWLKANLFDAEQETNWYQYLEFLTRLIPREQVPALIERLKEKGIHEQIRQNRRDLESGLGTKTLIEKDPLNLFMFAGHYTKEVAGNYQISFADGFLVSKDRDMLLIMGKPKRSPEDVDFSVALTAFFEEQIEAARVTFSEEEERNPDEVLTIGLTGPHPIAAHENKIIQADMFNMFITSFGMVIFLFVLAYGRPLAIFYVGIPLLCAEIWTLGIGYLLFGRLNLLTATFSAVIVGLGIDYAIHIFSRYLDERSQSRNPLESMRTSLSETGLGTLIGGFTTAMAFGAMGMSNFAGLREFATIAAVGILLCLVQMFVLLPCMLFFREGIRRKERLQRAQWDFKLGKLLNICLSHRRYTLLILAMGTLFLGYQAIQLRFTTDIRSVRARSNPSIKLQNEVTAKVGGSLRSLSFVLEGDTQEELYQIHDQLLPVLTKLKENGDLVRFDSLLVVLQNPKMQEENIRELKAAGLTGAEITSHFNEEMAAQSIRVTDPSKTYIHHLGVGLDTNEPITLDEIIATRSGFVRPFLNKVDGKLKTVIHVYPSTGLWEKDATRSLTEEILSAVDPGLQDKLFVTGIQSISDALKTMVQDSFKVSTGLAVALVIGILFFHFRSLSLVALTLTPLLTSVIWMLGTMQLMGIDITIINFVATPIIIGIGIDDGVHIVEKYLHRKTMSLGPLIASCGKAVTLTSLTTIFGFSSLFLAEYSGFQSLGLCAILGVLFCWLGSVILLPLLMDLFKVRFTREIDDPD